MRQGNQQDYEFGDCGHLDRFDGSADLDGVEDWVLPPVVYTVDDCAVVELAGEIDLLGFQRIAPLLDSVAAGPYRVVAIDLTRTTFFDCSGLSLLVRTHRRASLRGGRVTVICSHRLTLRIIHLSGLTDALCPTSTVEQALR